MRPAGWSPTLRRWRGGDSEPVRPDPPNATGRRWRLAGREGGTGGTPQHYPKARAGRRPPTPQTEQNQHPPGASQRPTPDCSAAEPPHVGAPAFSSPPAGGQNLPTGAHSRRCTGLRAGARVSKRASAPGSSFRTHAGNTSTVDSVLGLPVFVVPYKSPFLQLQHWNRGGFDGSQRTAYSIHCVCISETEKVKIGQALFLAKGHSD